MSDVHLCRLCVKGSQECINLYTENGYHNEVYEMATNYFDPMFLSAEYGSHRYTILCSECWQYIAEFHNFRESVIRAQTKLLEDRKQVHDIKEDIECISIADSELLDVDEKLIVNQKDTEYENNDEGKKDQSYIIDDESKYDDDASQISDEFENPVGVFVGGSFSEPTKCIDISLSDLDTLDMQFRSTQEGTSTSDCGTEINTEVIRNESMNECSSISDCEIKIKTVVSTDEGIENEWNTMSLLKERYVKSNSISDTKRDPKNDPDYIPGFTKYKAKKTKQKRSKCYNGADSVQARKSVKYETSEKRTIIESDDLIAKWLPSLECVECRESYSTFTLLKEHFRESHRSKQFYVVCCDRKLSYRCLVEEHISLHLDPNTFKCKLCGRSFTRRANFCSHRSAPCSSPHYPNRKRESYRDIEEVIAKWKPKLECVICLDSFTSFTLLKQHFRENHRSEKFYVVCCRRNFFYRHQMAEHIRLHLDPKAYICESCGKYFNRKSDLSTHIASKCNTKTV